MNGFRTLIITDLTRMSGRHVCIAGYEVDGDPDGQMACLRPVFRHDHPTEEWLRITPGALIRPFARIEFQAIGRVADPPHTEDLVVDPEHRVHRGMLAPELRRALLDETMCGAVGEIFDAEVHRDYGCYVRHGEGARSLGTVRAQVERVTYGPSQYSPTELEYRLAFHDEASVRYRLSVTDLAFRYSLDFLGAKAGLAPADAAGSLENHLRGADIYLRIGLARHWPKFPDRCYLQVNGVYSFPDYLGGSCFADLALTPGELAEYRARVFEG
jgi:hypothetical protein